MAKKRKSKGWLQYEREVEEIPERIKRGEITSIDEISEAYLVAIQRTAPAMSKQELLFLQNRSLGMHSELAKALAAEGHPVPGNDPNKPN